jgi:hypothetical protein
VIDLRTCNREFDENCVMGYFCALVPGIKYQKRIIPITNGHDGGQNTVFAKYDSGLEEQLK